MKKIIFIVISCVVAIVLLSHVGVLQALLLFLLVGVIPGTDVSIPSNVMFTINLGLSAVILLRLTALRAIEKRLFGRVIKNYSELKHRLPKRRFSEI